MMIEIKITGALSPVFRVQANNFRFTLLRIQPSINIGLVIQVYSCEFVTQIRM